MNQSKAVLSLAAVALLVTAAVLHAGPLTPPVGPVASTGKTLIEVEPRIAVNATNTPGDASSVFRITQPGSYYLTGNVLGEANKSGIRITASNVTLDLNGFIVDGQSIGTSIHGVFIDGAFSGTVVRNGTAARWGQNGVYAFGGSAQGNRIERVIARENVGVGIAPQDSASVIECSAIGNGTIGISVSSSATIIACVARGNGSTGISTGSGCTIEDCTARVNVGAGIVVGSGSVARGCSAFDNEVGFSVSGGGLVTGCSASQNNNLGFELFGSGNAADSNAYLNGGSGFSASVACTIENCRSGSNGLHGFTFSTACLIKGNAAYTNGSGGVGAGFHTTAGTDSRIEGNSVRGGDYGFWILGSRNVLIGNSSAGTTTAAWELAADNVYGVIVDRSAIGTAAVSGSAAVSVLGTTDPHANITH